MHIQNADHAARIVRETAERIHVRPTPDDLHALGSAELYLGRAEDAALHLEKAVTLAPDHAEAWNALAEASVRAEWWDDALSAAQHALELRPNTLRAHANLGNLHLMRGEAKAAAEVFAHALDIFGAHETLYTGLVNAHVLARNREAATAVVRQAEAQGIELDTTVLLEMAA